jgi:prepilin-type N-terminal cleavage/methylation domain-containing protein
MKNNQGFSLLEILISITLLAIMMVYVIDITNDGLETKDTVLAEDQELFQVEMAVNRIVTDISHMYNPLLYAAEKSNKKGEDTEESDFFEKNPDYNASKKFPKVTVNGLLVPVYEAEDKDTIIFLSAVNRRKVRDIKQSNYVWIKYDLRSSTITEDDKKRTDGDYEIIRYFNANDPYKEDFDWDNTKPQLLLRHVKELQFSYWHSERRKWVDTIRELPSKDNIIRGISLKLVWIDNYGAPQEVNRIIKINWPYFNTAKDEKEKKAKDSKLEDEEPEEDEEDS